MNCDASKTIIEYLILNVIYTVYWVIQLADKPIRFAVQTLVETNKKYRIERNRLLFFFFFHSFICSF